MTTIGRLRNAIEAGTKDLMSDLGKAESSLEKTRQKMAENKAAEKEKPDGDSR